MKTILNFKVIIAALALFIVMPPPQAGAAFTFSSTISSDDFTAVGFSDVAAGRRAWWVLNRTSPFFTVDISGAGGWAPIDVVTNDGALWIVWFRTVGTNFEVAFWRIVNGTLTTAATYTTSGWAIGDVVVAGDKLVLRWGEAGGNRAFWVVGTAGNIDATGVWPIGGTGWTFLILRASELLGTFGAEFFRFSTGQYTSYLYDNQGNWIAANTYQM